VLKEAARVVGSRPPLAKTTAKYGMTIARLPDGGQPSAVVDEDHYRDDEAHHRMPIMMR